MAKFYLLKSLAGGTVWLNRDMVTDIFVPDEKQSNICTNQKTAKFEDKFVACYSFVAIEGGETVGISTYHDTLEAAQAEAKMIALGHDQV